MAADRRFGRDGKMLAIATLSVAKPDGARSFGLVFYADTWRRIVMLKFFAACAFTGAFMVGSVAMADGLQQKQLSWDQLIQACQNPAAFQSQRQPNAIRLTCEDTQLVWEVDQSDKM